MPRKLSIVEGMHVLNYPALAQLVEKRFYVETPYSQIIQRKINRARNHATYEKEDFPKIVEREWKTHGAKQKSLDGVIVLDGMAPVEENVRIILDAL